MARTVLEICAGGGGQALGLEFAGFSTAAAIELDEHACVTLRENRPKWDVRKDDVNDVDGTEFKGIDLFAGGVPCPPFSIAGKQLGSKDERDLFPAALKLIEQSEPTAFMLENVRGLAGSRFNGYLSRLLTKIRKMGYEPKYDVLNASMFGVPQLRPRFVLVGMRPKYAARFEFPTEHLDPKTVGETLVDLMAANGWRGAESWAERANRIAPTLVGGSKKHGGADLGPTRAKRQWDQMGVDGLGVADAPPERSFSKDGKPKLTVRMTARIQGFPDSWLFPGRKTTTYRQVGNAFPPPVAAAVGVAIQSALDGKKRSILPVLTEIYEHALAARA